MLGKKGFTLLELSIVLVIIGLIAGTVVAGQSMIRASRVRSIARDISAYLVAVDAFTQKYNGPPGDIVNATAFWGAVSATQSACITTQGTGTQTCNGNGDGLIGDGKGNPQFYESYRAWQQLQIAGLIEGNYTGISGSASAAQTSLVGVNVPKTEIENVGFTFINETNSYNPGTTFYSTLGHVFMELGSQETNDTTEGPAFTPSEALLIDLKLDDGFPGKGLITTQQPNQGYDIGQCSSSTDFNAAVYQVNYNTVACALFVTITK